jgi:hypothetical protein
MQHLSVLKMNKNNRVKFSAESSYWLTISSEDGHRLELNRV